MRKVLLVLAFVACAKKPSPTTAVVPTLSEANLADPEVDYGSWPAADQYGLWADAARLFSLYASVPEVNDDGACPQVVKAPNRTTIEGDCGANASRVYGNIFIEGELSAPKRITYDAFRTVDEFRGLCVDSSRAGEMTIDRKGDTVSFTIEVMTEIGDCQSKPTKELRSLVEYSGTMKIVTADQDGDGMPEEAIFNGRGTFASKAGKVTVETAGQHFDKVICFSEAIAGSTTVTSGADVIEIRYDGVSQCTNTAPWARNGEAKGDLLSSWSL